MVLYYLIPLFYARAANYCIVLMFSLSTNRSTPSDMSYPFTDDQGSFTNKIFPFKVP